MAKKSLSTTLFFETLSLLMITVFLTGIAAFFLAKHELKLRTISGLQSAVYAKQDLLETAIARQRMQVSILGRDTSFARLPSVTGLVGFLELMRIDLHGNVLHLAGKKGGENVDPSVLQKSAISNYATFRAIFSERGWTNYVVSAPETNANGMRVGTLVAVFDPADLMTRLFDTEFMGQSAKVLLAIVQEGDVTLLHADDEGLGVPVHTDERNQVKMKERASQNEAQGFESTVDYAGIPVLSAYRTMPSIGWMMIVNIDAYEITTPILRLAIRLIGIGLMLVCLLSLSMFALAHRIVRPLEELAMKLNGLETRRWRFRRSIFTGNELEIVDRAAADLTGRLRQSYDHLEDIVRVRTEALRKENAQNAAILENIDYGLVMTDAKGSVVYMNRAGELLTGWESEDARQKDIHDVLPILDEKGSPIARDTHPAHLVLGSGKGWNPPTEPEYSLLHHNGTHTALHLRVTPMMKGKQCLGVIAVFRDVTEERRIDRVKSEFISLVSHQLRTPLSSMRWYLEMLLGKDAEKLTPQQQEYAEEVQGSNARMVRLVNALLNVSRLELGTTKLNAENVSLRTLLAEVIDSFKLELKRHSMDVKIDMKDSDSGEVKSDRSLLQLILENLISNAIKYGRESALLHIGITMDASTSTASIVIHDAGIGIPEAQQSQIFTKMFRATNARMSDTDGNGLGLYISHIAAETIGATLTFESHEDKGTTFRIELPMTSRP